MVMLSELVSCANEVMEIEKFTDYCPNGLQVQGRDQINKLVVGVTASQELIDNAIEKEACAILVHHGYFWRGEPGPIVGIKKNRIKALLSADVSLITYHLPLDGHPIYGNNVQLANLFNLTIKSWFGPSKEAIGVIGEFSEPVSSSALSVQIREKLLREPIHLSATKDKAIHRLAICSGGAQSFFECAIENNVDAFLTGEVSEQTFHISQETGVDFYAAGHHATERYGVQALGRFLADKYSIEYEFIDCDNPI